MEAENNGHAQPPSVRDAADLRSSDSLRFQQQSEHLRALGCRCVLHYTNGRAQPFFTAEGVACRAVDHYPAELTET